MSHEDVHKKKLQADEAERSWHDDSLQRAIQCSIKELQQPEEPKMNDKDTAMDFFRHFNNACHASFKSEKINLLIKKSIKHKAP